MLDSREQAQERDGMISSSLYVGRRGQLKLRQQQGVQIARQCAAILKRDFGVERVVLFGSLLDVDRMWWGSDIDLAVWGLAKQDLFRAGAAIEHGHDFDVDLVPVTKAKAHILAAIDRGLEL
jgi:predicted nucleotidyltransferase